MTEDILQNQQMQPEMQQSMPMEQVSQAEKMLPQSEVNELAGKIRADAYEKGRREAMMSQQANPAAAQQMAQGAISEEQVRQMVLAETQKLQQQQMLSRDAERIVGEFSSKMELGKDKYEDFDESVKQLDLRTIPEIVALANSVANTEDVMYDIAKNPYKVANLKILYQTNPNLARLEMNRLAKSISANKEAAAQVSTREPLSQMKPSTGIVDNGPGMTLKDFKKAKWARG